MHPLVALVALKPEVFDRVGDHGAHSRDVCVCPYCSSISGKFRLATALGAAAPCVLCCSLSVLLRTGRTKRRLPRNQRYPAHHGNLTGHLVSCVITDSTVEQQTCRAHTQTCCSYPPWRDHFASVKVSERLELELAAELQQTAPVPHRDHDAALCSVESAQWMPFRSTYSQHTQAAAAQHTGCCCCCPIRHQCGRESSSSGNCTTHPSERFNTHLCQRV